MSATDKLKAIIDETDLNEVRLDTLKFGGVALTALCRNGRELEHSSQIDIILAALEFTRLSASMQTLLMMQQCPPKDLLHLIAVATDSTREAAERLTNLLELIPPETAE